MVFLGHIRTDGSETVIQTAAEHSRNTSIHAGNCLRDAGLENAGSLAGLVHDCGKFKDEFTRYLRNPNGVRGSVNHSFAGFRLLIERYHTETADPMDALCAELLAYAAGAHHGTFDCVDEDRRSGFLHRITKENIGYEESVDNFLRQCVTEAELDSSFSRACEEVNAIYRKLLRLDPSQEEMMYYIGLLARLLLSAVIEGDRRDTAEFMCGVRSTSAREDMESFWAPYLERVERKLDKFAQDTPIQRARREISDRCRAFAEKKGGVYRLNVPTGAGKTLSSLRYALAHGKKWGKRRLIFTSPLLSILEQNAAVLRDYLEDDSIILEHHSNVVHTEDGWDLDQRELAVESWDAPVVITTMVQLLNTLFEGNTTAIRRFHGLCNSVIVIDEVQTVPTKMLSLFTCALDFLANVCGVTVIMCSATQPYLEKTNHPLRSVTEDMIPYDAELWEVFRRTVIIDGGRRTMEQITEFAVETLENVSSLLVVCNRKDEAAYLFTQLRSHAEAACQLSAAMCTAHRRSVLARLQTALAQGKRCLCVSTQVIEAGVDISFQRVIRLTAGMDSVIQSAGRCNRHGESELPAQVSVVSCLGEKLEKLRDIRDAKQATESLLDAFRQDSAPFDGELSSQKAIKWYYQKLYGNMPKDHQDYKIPQKSLSLFDLLSDNHRYFDEEAPYAKRFFMAQAFRLAGALFEVFDNAARDVVVPYAEGAALIAELGKHGTRDPSFLRGWIQRAKPYTVSVYDYQLKVLGNAVTEYDGIAVLNPAFYDEEIGLLLRPKEYDFLEV